MNISEQDKNLLSAMLALEQQQKQPTIREMIDSGRWAPVDGDETSLAAILERLVENGLVDRRGDAFLLTGKGLRLAKQFDAEEFGQLMIACQRSPAYRKYCTVVYGTDRCHFDMMTQAQFDKVTSLLCLEKPTRILDVGCGTGEITE